MTADNGFSANYRILKSADFLKLSRQGKTLRAPAFKIQILANNLKHPRLGITVSRHASKKAKVRNTIKRQVREDFRLRKHHLPSLDLVFIANTSTGMLSRKELSLESGRLFEMISETYRKKNICN